VGIEEIKNKIIEDAKAEAELVIEHARARARALVAEAEQRGAAEAARILAEAHERARRLEERTRIESVIEKQKARADLECRLMAQVFERAREAFFSLPKTELESALIGAILSTESRGTETVRFSPALKQCANKRFLTKLNSAAAESGRPKPAFSFDREPASRADIELIGDGYVILVSIEDEFKNIDPEVRKSIISLLFEESGLT
jgi:vacuolar-type H+-ATPase subunit E/Vma4